MSWAKDPKDLYDVRVHRFGSKVAEEMELKEKEKILKSQPWKKTTPEQQKYIVQSGVTKTIEIPKGGVKYSADAFTVAAVLYGKDSEIYKAMLKGEKVSLLVRKSIEEKMKRGQTKVEIEQCFLLSCLNVEKGL